MDITLGEVNECWLTAFEPSLDHEARITDGNMKLRKNSALSYFIGPN